MLTFASTGQKLTNFNKWLIYAVLCSFLLSAPPVRIFNLQPETGTAGGIYPARPHVGQPIFKKFANIYCLHSQISKIFCNFTLEFSFWKFEFF